MASKKSELEAIFIPPEGVAKMTGEITYDGRWYEFLGEEEVGRFEDEVTGEVIPGRIIQKKGRLLQVVDDGDPTTPVTYQVFDGDEADYKPTVQADSYSDNVQKFIAEGGFKGHPSEPKE